jgi:antitoxin YefM
MLVANFSEFRSRLKKFLDEVEFNHETVIIKRGEGSGSVLVSLDEYNSLIETVHLMKSTKNLTHLRLSMAQIETGEVVTFASDSLE